MFFIYYSLHYLPSIKGKTFLKKRWQKRGIFQKYFFSQFSPTWKSLNYVSSYNNSVSPFNFWNALSKPFFRKVGLISWEWLGSGRDSSYQSLAKMVKNCLAESLEKRKDYLVIWKSGDTKHRNIFFGCYLGRLLFCTISDC